MKNRMLALLLSAFSVVCLAGTAADYQLGPGDVVKISAYDNPELGTEGMLSREGDLNFGLIGKVHLGGLTVSQAENRLAESLQRGGFVNHPQVTLIVSQYRSQRISVLGEFNRPGVIQLDQPTDLFAVIAQVGGVAQSGGDTVVVIHRGQRTEYSLSRLMADNEPSRRTVILSGDDVVYSPRALIFVNGEVNRAGSYRLEAGMTVLQAISSAGGFTAKAAQNRLKIHRADQDGKMREIDARANDPLQVGDVVVVEESWF